MVKLDGRRGPKWEFFTSSSVVTLLKDSKILSGNAVTPVDCSSSVDSAVRDVKELGSDPPADNLSLKKRRI